MLPERQDLDTGAAREGGARADAREEPSPAPAASVRS
jgi:hypothetical protein